MSYDLLAIILLINLAHDLVHCSPTSQPPRIICQSNNKPLPPHRLLLQGHVRDPTTNCQLPPTSPQTRVELINIETSNIYCEDLVSLGSNGELSVTIPITEKLLKSSGFILKICSNKRCKTERVSVTEDGIIKVSSSEHRIQNGSGGIYAINKDWCLTESSAQPNIAIKTNDDNLKLKQQANVKFNIQGSSNEQENIKSNKNKEGNGVDEPSPKESHREIESSRTVGLSTSHPGPARLRRQTPSSSPSESQAIPLEASARRLEQLRKLGRRSWIRSSAPLWHKGASSEIPRAMGNKKNGWDESVMGWIKRTPDHHGKDLSGVAPWDETVMSWMKRDNGRGDKNDLTISEHGEGKGDPSKGEKSDNTDKREWEDVGMNWVKKDDKDVQWEDVGMPWMKRGNAEWEDVGMPWMKRGNEEWEDVGMSWMKRSNPEWEDVGMPWMKRGNPEWEDVGMSWMKRGSPEWEDVGMPWMKRGNEEWEDVGMPWMKRGNAAWEDVGMSWMKRDADKKWEDVGMGWIKRDKPSDTQRANPGTEDKREWEDVGMAWVKRGNEPDNKKREWEDVGMSWVKRPDQSQDKDVSVADLLNIQDKREWEDVGMSWVRRRKRSSPNTRLQGVK